MKRLKILLTSLFLIGFTSNALSAQSNISLAGQTHFYSIFPRQSGSSIVIAKIIFNNNNETLLREFKFISKNDIENLRAWQLDFNSECVTYEIDMDGLELTPFVNQQLQKLFQEVGGKTIKVVNNGPIKMSDQDIHIGFEQLVCVEIAEKIGADQFTDVSIGNFQSVGTNQSGRNWTLTLPKPVTSDETGALILSYELNQSLKHIWNQLDFKTLQVDEMVNQNTLAVIAERGMIIKNNKNSQKIKSDKNNSENILLLSSFVGITAVPTLQAVNHIGRVGELQLSSDYLLPGEIYSLDLKIADQNWKFYWSYFVWASILFLLIIAFIALKRRRYKRRRW